MRTQSSRKFAGKPLHTSSFVTLIIFVHDSVRACVGSFQKLSSQDFFIMPRKETGTFAVQTCMHGFSICSHYEHQYQIRKVQQTSRKGM